MKTSIHLVVSCFLLFVSGTAQASTVSGSVVDLRTRASDGLQYVTLSGSPTPRPACSTGRAYYMIRDESSDTGKAQFAMLLSALVSGRSISIIGSGACGRWMDGEDIDYIIMTQ